MHSNKSEFSLLRISLFISIVALFTIPGLITYNYFPLSKFYSELSALIIGAFIILIGVFYLPRVSISSAGIASFAFAIFVLLQILVVKINFIDISLVTAFEMIIAGGVSVVITSFISGHEHLQKKIVSVIAWGLVIGTFFQLIYGLLQFTGGAIGYPQYILQSGQGNVIGNIGQKNDFIDFLMMGFFALSYLYFAKKINLIAYIPLALFYGLILTLSTSRTIFFIIILSLLLVGIVWFVNRKNNEHRLRDKQIIGFLLATFIVLFILGFIIPKLMVAATDQSNVVSGLDRFSSADIGQSTYRRFYEWLKDLVIFTQHPIFGVGIYQYAKAAIDLMLTPRFIYIPANSALYTHSHDTPLNLLAETGIIGFFITMVYGFGYSLYRVLRNFNNLEAIFVGLIIMAPFAQGLLQFPLWYTYFLLPFIMLLSVDKPIYGFNNTKVLKIAVSILFALFMWFCSVNVSIYNQLVADSVVPQDADTYASNLNQLSYLADNSVIWEYPALLIIDGYNMPGSNRTNAALTPQKQCEYADRLASELPYPGVLFKQIICHRMLGDESSSIYYANLLAHAFPFFKDRFADQLRSSPTFTDEVNTIDNFHYQDRSIFAEMFKKK